MIEEIKISADQNTIDHQGKQFKFIPSPQFEAGSLDCDYCAFLNTEICEKAPCDLDRMDETKGYFKTVKL